MRRRGLQFIVNLSSLYNLRKSPPLEQWWHDSCAPTVTGTQGTVGPIKSQSGTKWHLWKHIQSCAVGGQYTVIYTDSSAMCWNGQGHHQRALWANIFSLRRHFRCPGIKALLCFPFSCLMTVIRFLLLWFLLSLRPFATWVSRWLTAKARREFCLSGETISECESVAVRLWVNPNIYNAITLKTVHKQVFSRLVGLNLVL